MAKIIIQVTEPTGIKLGAEKYEFDDIVSADSETHPEKYKNFCAAVNHGWARNAQTNETGDRKPGSVKLNVDDVVQDVS